MTGVAVVTGASRGLGEALAHELRARGFAVAGCSADGSLEAGVERCDVTDWAEVEHFAESAADGLGPIDLWINCAGVIGPVGPTRTTDPGLWARVVEVNLLGTVHGSRAFLAHHAPGAVLVNIASRAGLHPGAGIAAYSSTKAGVIAFTEALADEEVDGGIEAVVVIPPSVDTDMQRALLTQPPDMFPGVVDSRRRQDNGEIHSPRQAAELILAALLDRPRTGVIIDLT